LIQNSRLCFPWKAPGDVLLIARAPFGWIFEQNAVAWSRPCLSLLACDSENHEASSQPLLRPPLKMLLLLSLLLLLLGMLRAAGGVLAAAGTTTGEANCAAAVMAAAAATVGSRDAMDGWMPAAASSSAMTPAVEDAAGGAVSGWGAAGAGEGATVGLHVPAGGSVPGQGEAGAGADFSATVKERAGAENATQRLSNRLQHRTWLVAAGDLPVLQANDPPLAVSQLQATSRALSELICFSWFALHPLTFSKAQILMSR
jgi:hypothetical protein